MEWGHSERLKDINLIDKFEKQVGYQFPEDYRQCVIEHGGAWVMPDGFDTERYKGRAFNRLFSFDPNDRSSIWEVGIGLDETDEECVEVMRNYVIFADSPFGDPICFDRRDDSVVYVDHETLEVEYVAPSFQAFLDKLYEDED